MTLPAAHYVHGQIVAARRGPFAPIPPPRGVEFGFEKLVDESAANHRRENVHLRPSRSPASCYPLLWCDLHRRLKPMLVSFHKPEITPSSNSDDFRNGAEVDKTAR
jgi:hypothetical protein